jgi:hypothetical protein
MRPLLTTGFRDYLIRVRRITDTPEGELVAVLKTEWRTP